jgi:hypothetical protein
MFLIHRQVPDSAIVEVLADIPNLAEKSDDEIFEELEREFGPFPTFEISSKFTTPPPTKPKEEPPKIARKF